MLFWLNSLKRNKSLGTIYWPLLLSSEEHVSERYLSPQEVDTLVFLSSFTDEDKLSVEALRPGK